MKAFVLGATGATGSLVVRGLLAREVSVLAIVRHPEKLQALRTPLLETITGTVLDLHPNELDRYLDGCEVTISCLGHNINFKGMYGKPTRLVTDSTKRTCEAIQKRNEKHKFILMNTTANRNLEIHEDYTLLDKAVLGLLTLLLPPQSDNVKAAQYLSKTVGKKGNMEWVAVRPDSLINETEVSKYSVFEGIQRSPVINAGKVSRINVSDFIVKLACEESLWDQWKYKMPVIYNG